MDRKTDLVFNSLDRKTDLVFNSLDRKTDLVFEYFEQKYGFDIQKLGIDKYQIKHFFESNNKYFDRKDSIKLLIVQIEKLIDGQIKENKKILSSEGDFIKNKIERKFSGYESLPEVKPIIVSPKEVKETFIYLYIDSKDRDFSKFKYPSNYSIDIKPLKIKKIQIKEVIIINSEKDQDASDSMDKFPYILFGLNFWQGKSIGSNNSLTKSSMVLTNYIEKNGYRYYSLDDTFDLESSPIDKIDIQFSKPNGEIFYFGYNNSQSFNTINFLKFKVYL